MATQTFTDNVEVVGSRDVEQLAVRGYSSQTIPLQTWENSAGDVLAQVADDGRLQLGDLSIDAPDALLEANNDLTLPTSEAIQGVQSRGLIRGAIANAIAWVVQELELLGASVAGLHTALRVKLMLDSPGDVTQAQGRAADFEAINRSGVISAPAGTMTGVQSTVTNQIAGYLDEAIGVSISVQDEGTNQIQTAYGVKIEDMPDTGQDAYAIHTGTGVVFIGDQMGINVPSPGAQLELESADANRAALVARAASAQAVNVRETQDSMGAVLEGIDKGGATVQKEQSIVPGTPAAGYRKLYPKADGWYDQDSTGLETKVGSFDHAICQGRLTLSSNTPIPTNNVLAATILYFTPFQGNQVALFDGTKWALFPFTQLSLNLNEDMSELAANTNYDVFLFDNSGTLTLAPVQWTNDSTRAVALAMQDGIWVLSTDHTYRYVGTIRTDSSGNGEDSYARRFVWNMYNRVQRNFYALNATTHTYAVGGFRPWNNDTAFRVEFVVGGSSAVRADIIGAFKAGADGLNNSIAVGFDSTSSYSPYVGASYNYNVQPVAGGATGTILVGTPGHHYLQPLEYGNPTASTFINCWIEGEIWS